MDKDFNIGYIFWDELWGRTTTQMGDQAFLKVYNQVYFQVYLQVRLQMGEQVRIKING